MLKRMVTVFMTRVVTSQAALIKDCSQTWRETPGVSMATLRPIVAPPTTFEGITITHLTTLKPSQLS